jgi:hypothetical protein
MASSTLLEPLLDKQNVKINSNKEEGKIHREREKSWEKFKISISFVVELLRESTK